MPSKSEKQRKLFGAALSIKRGESPKTDTSAGKIAEKVSEEQLADFAKKSLEKSINVQEDKKNMAKKKGNIKKSNTPGINQTDAKVRHSLKTSTKLPKPEKMRMNNPNTAKPNTQPVKRIGVKKEFIVRDALLKAFAVLIPEIQKEMVKDGFNIQKQGPLIPLEAEALGAGLGGAEAAGAAETLGSAGAAGGGEAATAAGAAPKPSIMGRAKNWAASPTGKATMAGAGAGYAAGGMNKKSVQKSIKKSNVKKGGMGAAGGAALGGILGGPLFPITAPLGAALGSTMMSESKRTKKVNPRKDVDIKKNPVIAAEAAEAVAPKLASILTGPTARELGKNAAKQTAIGIAANEGINQYNKMRTPKPSTKKVSKGTKGAIAGGAGGFALGHLGPPIIGPVVGTIGGAALGSMAEDKFANKSIKKGKAGAIAGGVLGGVTGNYLGGKYPQAKIGKRSAALAGTVGGAALGSMAQDKFMGKKKKKNIAPNDNNEVSAPISGDNDDVMGEDVDFDKSVAKNIAKSLGLVKADGDNIGDIVNKPAGTSSAESIPADAYNEWKTPGKYDPTGTKESQEDIRRKRRNSPGEAWRMENKERSAYNALEDQPDRDTLIHNVTESRPGMSYPKLKETRTAKNTGQLLPAGQSTTQGYKVPSTSQVPPAGKKATNLDKALNKAINHAISKAENLNEQNSSANQMNRSYSSAVNAKRAKINTGTLQGPKVTKHAGVQSMQKSVEQQVHKMATRKSMQTPTAGDVDVQKKMSGKKKAAIGAGLLAGGLYAYDKWGNKIPQSVKGPLASTTATNVLNHGKRILHGMNEGVRREYGGSGGSQGGAQQSQVAPTQPEEQEPMNVKTGKRVYAQSNADKTAKVSAEQVANPAKIVPEKMNVSPDTSTYPTTKSVKKSGVPMKKSIKKAANKEFYTTDDRGNTPITGKCKNCGGKTGEMGKYLVCGKCGTSFKKSFLSGDNSVLTSTQKKTVRDNKEYHEEINDTLTRKEPNMERSELDMNKSQASLNVEKAIFFLEGYEPMSDDSVKKSFHGQIPEVMSDIETRPPLTWWEKAVNKAMAFTDDPVKYSTELWYSNNVNKAVAEPIEGKFKPTLKGEENQISDGTRLDVSDLAGEGKSEKTETL